MLVLQLSHLGMILRRLHMQPAPRTYQMDGLSNSQRASTTAATTPLVTIGTQNFVMRVVVAMERDRGEPVAVVVLLCMKQSPSCCSSQMKRHPCSKHSLRYPHVLCVVARCALLHVATVASQRAIALVDTSTTARYGRAPPFCHRFALHQNGAHTNRLMFKYIMKVSVMDFVSTC
jgi:hypothetical protein